MVMMIQWPVNAISLFILLFTGKANIYLYFLKLFYQLLFLVLCQDWQKEQKNSTFFPDHIWKIIILFFLSLYVLFTSQTYFLSFVFFFLSTSARDNLVFLERWFLKFPHYLNRSLFITGESYAGNNFILVPHFSQS